MANSPIFVPLPNPGRGAVLGVSPRIQSSFLFFVPPPERGGGARGAAKAGAVLCVFVPRPERGGGARGAAKAGEVLCVSPIYFGFLSFFSFLVIVLHDFWSRLTASWKPCNTFSASPPHVNTILKATLGFS